MKKLIIFDFDGVLADSFETFYPLIRDAMKQIGLSLTRKQYSDFFMGNVHMAFKNFIGDEKKYLIFSEFRKSNYDKYYFDKNSGAKLFPGTKELIKKLVAKYTLTIASSGHQTNVENLLDKNGTKDMFSLIIANTATTKEGMIKEILTKLKSKAEESIMISDTVGDIELAKKMELQTIAVTWGFHSIKLLKTAKPDYVIKNFKELEYTLLTNL